MTHLFKTLFFIVLCLQMVKAQNNKTGLQIKEKESLIFSIKTNLEESYVDLNLAKKMIIELDKNLKSNKYKNITAPQEFAKTVTNNLQNISKDLHLKVQFEPERIAKEKVGTSETIKLENEKRTALQMAEMNYGFTEVKILDGNIGYLNLRLFADTKYAEETATSAMNFLSNTQAIIIDLRNNGGGVPSMMQLLASYFFDETPVLLSNFYERKTDTKTQLYTLEKVNGKRSINKPVYILTGKQTFSAAEAFAYTLKHLEKAITVGETTQGGANRTKRITLNDAFSISVPYIQSIHPVTKTNWEGKGVQPTLEVHEKDAFVKAYITAVNTNTKGNKNALLNKIGYSFLKDKFIDNAIIVFEENTKLFPANANAWDSLGEAYFTKGDKVSALKSYKRVLELDPGSESAKTMIKKLESNTFE